MTVAQATSTCSNCLYWTADPNWKRSNIKSLAGLCRINAPVLIPNDATAVNGWPFTTAGAWCGDWKKGD